jgi:DNA-binding MarR family transcriptional regulator
MTKDPIKDSYDRWIELGWDAPDEMAAFMSVLRAHRLLVDRVHEALGVHHLSITEHASLVYLAMSEDGRQPLGRIAKRVMIGPGRCNYMINKLEGAGLVRREPHPYDGRTTLAVLTEPGRAVVFDGLRRIAEIRNGFDGMSEEQLRALRDLTATLLESDVAARRPRRTPRINPPPTSPG